MEIPGIYKYICDHKSLNPLLISTDVYGFSFKQCMESNFNLVRNPNEVFQPTTLTASSPDSSHLFNVAHCAFQCATLKIGRSLGTRLFIKARNLHVQLYILTVSAFSIIQ